MGKYDMLLMAAVVVGGGYLILKTTGLGGVAEGAGEAAKGLGAGIGQAGMAGGQAVEDVSTFMFGIAGEFGRQQQQIIELQSQINQREMQRQEQIEVAAYEKSSEELAELRAAEDIAEQERKTIRDVEQTERVQLRQERRTDAAELSWYERLGGGLLKYWQYSKTGLLSSFISSQSSIDVAQTATPTITGAAVSEPTISTGSGGGSIKKTPTMPADAPVGTTVTFGPDDSYAVTKTYSGPARTPEPTKDPFLKRAVSWGLRTFGFFRTI